MPPLVEFQPGEIMGQSELFPTPDQVWNYQEGFVHNASVPNAPADTGGYHAGLFDDGTQVRVTDIHIQHLVGSPTVDWNTHPGTTPPQPTVPILRLVAYLHPTGGTNGFDAGTAFEVLAPQTMSADPATKRVLVIPSHPAGVVIRSPFAAWMDPINYGFGATSAPPAAVDAVSRPLNIAKIVSMSATPESDGIEIIAAHMPRVIGGGELMLSSQRILQMVTAVRLLLDPANSAFPASWPNQHLPIDAVLVIGGSNGGFVAQNLAIFYPDRVHGALSLQFSPSMRALANSQEIAMFMTATQGFSGSTFAHTPGHLHSYGSFLNAHGFDYGTGNLLRMWRDGFIRRPIFLLCADEDTTGTGEEGLSFIAGSDQYQPSGHVPAGTVLPGGSQHPTSRAPIFWTVEDRGCHTPRSTTQIPGAILATVPPGTGSNPTSPMQHEHEMLVLPFLDEVVRSADATPLTPADRPVPSSATPISAKGEPESDPYDHVLARLTTQERHLVATTDPAAPVTNLLDQVPAFLREQRGLGTWLGMGTSLAVDDSGGVYVGGADGVVSRLKVDSSLHPMTGDPTSLKLDTRLAPSATAAAAGQYSHGYGTYGLQVDSDWIVFATHRKLFCYDTQTLTMTHSVDLTWAQQRPLKIEIVDGFFSGSSGKYIVYLTFYGELVVREITADLPIRAQWSMPGLVDFAIGDGLEAPATETSLPIFVSAWAQKQVFRLTMDTQAPQAIVTAASAHLDEPVYGLVWSDSASASGLFAIQGFTTLNIIKFKSYPGGPMLAIDPTETITMPTFTSTTKGVSQIVDRARRIVPMWGLGILIAFGTNGKLFIVPTNAAVTALDLDPTEVRNGLPTFEFPALFHPLAIASGNVSGQIGEDLVIATQNGQVVYLNFAQLLVPTEIQRLGEETLGEAWQGAGAVETPDAQSSGSVVANWAMTWGPGGVGSTIECADQCGRRWSLDPATGVPQYVDTMQLGFPGSTTVLGKPFRDLSYVGWDPPPVPFPLPPQVVSDFATVLADQPPLFSQNRTLYTAADFSRNIPPTSPLATSVAGDLDVLAFSEQYVPFHNSGDMLSVGGNQIVAYWGSRGKNTVLGFTLDAQSNFSVQRTSSNAPGMPSSFVQTHLKNSVGGNFAPWNVQALRLGKFNQGTIRAIVGSSGGSLAAVELGVLPVPILEAAADPDAYPDSSTGDHGFGGAALCVAQVVEGAANPTIFFGTLNSHGGGYPGSSRGFEMVSSLHVYSFVEAAPSPSKLVEHARYEFVGPGSGRPRLFGLCGLAVGNLVDDATPDGAEPELVMATLNGDLLVYQLQATPGAEGSVTLGNLLHWDVYDGSLGATNSIRVDETADPRAVYVAGSMGTRKFIVGQ